MTVRPVVGVTSYLEVAQMGVWDTRSIFLPHTYVTPIMAAGATVMVLPPQEADHDCVMDVLSRVDALAVSGGYDVNPSLYGQDRHSRTDEPRSDRDAWEIALVRAATSLDMPILGVCRGAQVLNVARGGTLHQHLPDVVGSTRHQGKDGVFGRLPVAVAAPSLLSEVHDAERVVPVYHHQAIDSLGAGLRVAALSDDGIVEAVEDPAMSFCVATQWHPEQDPEGSARLYSAFVEAATRFRDNRVSAAGRA